jgi:hypothetical protein
MYVNPIVRGRSFLGKTLQEMLNGGGPACAGTPQGVNIVAFTLDANAKLDGAGTAGLADDITQGANFGRCLEIQFVRVTNQTQFVRR